MSSRVTTTVVNTERRTVLVHTSVDGILLVSFVPFELGRAVVGHAHPMIRTKWMLSAWCVSFGPSKLTRHVRGEWRHVELMRRERDGATR